MAGELLLSGFLLTRDDWEELGADAQALFTEMLAEEGRAPRFEDRRQSGYRFKRARPLREPLRLSK